MKTPQPDSKSNHRLAGLFRRKKVMIFVFLLAVLLGYIYWHRPLSVEERQFVGNWGYTVFSNPTFTVVRTWEFFPDRTSKFIQVKHTLETKETPATQDAVEVVGKWYIWNGKLYVQEDYPGSVYAKVAMLRTRHLLRTGTLAYPLGDEAKLTYGSTKNTCDVAWWDYSSKSYDPPKEWRRVPGITEQD